MIKLKPNTNIKSLTITPTNVHEKIIEFCKEIVDPPNPTYVIIKPKESSKELECFMNVKRIVASSGGSIQYGWTIWEWPRVMVEAEFHAVWKTPQDSFIDITPSYNNANRILFLPDSRKDYDFTKGFYKVDNIRKPLNDHPLIKEFIKTAEEIFDFVEKFSPGRFIEFSDQRQWDYYYLLNEKKVNIQMELNKIFPIVKSQKIKRRRGKIK